VYGYQAVNVEAQSRSLSSLLNWMKRMIAVRKTSRVFGRGTLAFIRPANRAVLVYLRQLGEEVILCVANLSRTAQSAELDLSAWRGRVPAEMLGKSRFKRIGEAPFVVTLAPYGFFWFHLVDEVDEIDDSTAASHEWVTLVFSNGWKMLTEGRSRQLLERDVLPNFLASRRWFSEKGNPAFQARVAGSIPLSTGEQNFALAIVDATGNGHTSRYLVPVAVCWGRVDHLPDLAPYNVLALLRRGPREGVLVDALADRNFVGWALHQIKDGATLDWDGGHVEFRATARFAQGEHPPVGVVARANSGEQPNSSIIIDTRAVLKLYRRFVPGAGAETDMSRFLTDVVGYVNTPGLFGTIELQAAGERTTLAVLHAFVDNQGDDWAHTNAYLDRFLDEERLVVSGAPEDCDEPGRHAAFLNRIRQIGRRVAELHLALASRPDIAAFAPEPISAADVVAWTERLVGDLRMACEQLAARFDRLDPKTQPWIDAFLSNQAQAIERVRDLLPPTVDANKIRHHGDLHLGQVLIVKDDAFIIGFEGDPTREPLAPRGKAPAARDVAAIISSLDYAATDALARAVKNSPEGTARLTAALGAWQRQAVKTLVASVREASGDSRLWPGDPTVVDRLLRFFIVEKAVGEIGHKLKTRPDRVHVPVAALWQTLFAEGEGP
jgi:maltose alpha-D-glucosyltransferase / alpha-amylase